MHMRVHTFIHQYQYRYTNTEGYDYASIMCGDSYALTTSKVSTWAVLATRPMETSFRQKSSENAIGFERPGGWLRDPVQKKMHLLVRFFGRACERNRYAESLRRGLFSDVKKMRTKDPGWYVGCGLLRDPLL